MIDLHAHSTFSDGSLHPAELIQLAVRTGLRAVALTDHDSTAGLPAFREAARAAPDGFTAVPGVELSADVQPGTMHILGYFIDARRPALQRALERIRKSRDERNERMIEILRRRGMDLTMADVRACAGEHVVGRPHIAAAMLAKGCARSKADAFQRFLGKGCCAYVDRYRLAPADCVRLVRAAGGVAVLAHPLTLRLPPRRLRAAVRDLADAGLGGIEVYYPEHTPALRKQYLTLAEEFDLVVTGGSDYHGDANPAIRLGTGFGALNVPDDAVDRLRERAEP